MFFHRQYTRRYIFSNLKYYFKEIKWGCQRFKKGYCDSDWWDISLWFFHNLEGLLSDLAKHTISYPSTCNSYEAWIEELNSMVEKLHIFNNYSYEDFQSRYELGQEILEWFSRRCFDLWD